MKRLILILLSIIGAVTLCKGQPKMDTLYVYGPGGPFAPIQECAQLYGKQHGIFIKVVAGPQQVWLKEATEHADLFFGGAEYMLTQFATEHPELVVPESRSELYMRTAAILVRPGNPKNIKSLKDLGRPGIQILDVNGAGQMGLWEDLAGKQKLIGAIQQNIRKTFANSALGIAAWNADNSYDAWITFESWHNRLPEVTSLVNLPVAQTVYRGTPVVLSSKSRHADLTKDLVKFMRSQQGHKIFIKWGWK